MTVVVVVFIIVIFVLFSLNWLWGKWKSFTFDWQKEHVVIVGGLGCLGSALGKELCSRGARVSIVDLSTPNKTEERDNFYQGDVTDECKVEQIFAHHFPTATILINSQGTLPVPLPLLELPASDILSVLQVNLISVFYTVRAFLKYSHQPRLIVNVSSCLGLGGVPLLSHYCASKFGLVGFSESLRNELLVGCGGVGVLTVCPFYLQDSPMFRGKVQIKFPWLTVPLTSQNVAKCIIQAMERGDRELYLPWWVNLIGLVRLLPTFIFDKLQSIFV